MSYQKKVIYGKKSVTRPPLHIALFLTFSVFELQRGYLYQNGVEFRQKAGLNLFWGHLHYFSEGIWTFPLLSDTYASAPIAERAIIPNSHGGRGAIIFAEKGKNKTPFKWKIASSSIYTDKIYPKETIKKKLGPGTPRFNFGSHWKKSKKSKKLLISLFRLDSLFGK